MTAACSKMLAILPLATESQGPCFLGLPPEIRNMIYNLHYPTLPPVMNLFSTKARGLPSSALVDTCKQIRSETHMICKEAKHSFYRCTFVVNLDHYQDLEGCEHQLQAHLEAHMQHLSHHDINMMGFLVLRTRSFAESTEEHVDRLVVTSGIREMFFSGWPDRYKTDLKHVLMRDNIMKPSYHDMLRRVPGEQQMMTRMATWGKDEMIDVIATVCVFLRAHVSRNGDSDHIMCRQTNGRCTHMRGVPNRLGSI